MFIFEPVQLKLQMDQAIPAKAVGITFIHKLLLAGGYLDAETLALRDIARLAFKSCSASRTFTCFMIAHERSFERRVCIYA